jgi:hypothetical protein
MTDSSSKPLLKDPPVITKAADTIPLSMTSPRPTTLSRSAMESSSKALLLSHPLNPEWAAHVLTVEQKELDKLEQILLKERKKAEKRQQALEELEEREEIKARVVKERAREREEEVKEKNRQREGKVKAKEEESR